MTREKAIDLLETITKHADGDTFDAIRLALDALKREVHQEDGCESGACTIHYPGED